MSSQLITFEQLRDAAEKMARGYDMGLIRRAYELADEKHNGQHRRSGEPYIMHPLHVALLLVELGLDEQCICAALLHDVVEDTDTPLSFIKEQFGAEVAELVDGVTKLGMIPFSSREEEQAENLRKMLLAMSKDIRVMLIKLCDRLHNMRTLDAMPDAKRRIKARETMEVYAPIAHRLGIASFKDELEDLALRYLDPAGYEEIRTTLAQMERENGAFIETVTGEIREKLAANGIENIEIQARVKSTYGIYRKLVMQNRSMEEIYDIYAIRILVDNVAECYNALGAVHDLYRPIPNRFKDYISTPKQNMYQSLHTTVIARNAVPFEIQIRTFEMHRSAEYGVAAHWKYKVGIRGGDRLDSRLEWVRQLLENQKESGDATDLLRSIKSDLLPEEVFVFTPKGDVVDLPAGATVIDFAYAIHSAVGHRMIGAKVNGRLVPITYKVNSSEVIEVVTGPKDKGPSRDWLNIVTTSEARSKIRAWFKRERRDENIQEGKAMLEKELRREMITLTAEQFTTLVEELVRRQRLNTPEELFAELGYGGLAMSRIMPKVREYHEKIKKPADEPIITPESRKARTKAVDGVIIEGLDSCLVRFSRCCNPLPGDEIVGFITRGHGVSIHKKNCRNVISAMATEEGRNRLVQTHWDDEIREQFRVTICVLCNDRTGLLADISGKLSSMRIPIYALNTSIQDGQSSIIMTIGVSGKEHLQVITDKLRKVRGVISITRVGE